MNSQVPFCKKEPKKLGSAREMVMKRSCHNSTDEQTYFCCFFFKKSSESF